MHSSHFRWLLQLCMLLFWWQLCLQLVVTVLPTSLVLVVGGVVLRTSPLIASQMLRILMVDWMWLNHSPQFGPSSVRILNLLMSIVNFCSGKCDVCLKGAYTSRCQMPELNNNEVDLLW